MDETFFNRTARVTAYRQPAGFIGANPNFFENLGNGIEIEKLRVTFSIEKKIGSDPNTCELVVFNAGENTRVFLKTTPLTVRLDAGYEGVNKHLFFGNLKWGEPKHTGVEWESRMILLDGGRAISKARVSRSYKAGTPLLVVLRDAAKAMGQTLPREIELDPELRATIPSGTTLDGFASPELTRLLAPYDYTWSIQNGKLQILKATQVREDLAHLINQRDAGLVGRPEYGAPAKGSGVPTLSFRCYLFPELMPGGKILMDSQRVKGLHRMQAVKHTGDTKSGDWYTDVEAKPL